MLSAASREEHVVDGILSWANRKTARYKFLRRLFDGIVQYEHPEHLASARESDRAQRLHLARYHGCCAITERGPPEGSADRRFGITAMPYAR
jgi:hypothetical protein